MVPPSSAAAKHIVQALHTLHGSWGRIMRLAVKQHTGYMAMRVGFVGSHGPVMTNLLASCARSDCMRTVYSIYESKESIVWKQADVHIYDFYDTYGWKMRYHTNPEFPRFISSDVDIVFASDPLWVPPRPNQLTLHVSEPDHLETRQHTLEHTMLKFVGIPLKYLYGIDDTDKVVNDFVKQLEQKETDTRSFRLQARLGKPHNVMDELRETQEEYKRARIVQAQVTSRSKRDK